MPFFAKFGGGNSNKFGFTRGASAPLTAPTSLSATPVNTSVSISFTAPTNTGGIPITNYQYSFNNSTWTALSPTDATSPVTVPGLTQNTGYTVYLRAVNAIGSGPASSGVSFTTQGVPTSAPTSLSAIPVNTSATISFTAAASSTALTNYEYSFNNSTWTALSPADAVSPVTVSGLTQNTAYTVYLRGVNSYGSGPGSAGVSFTTEGVPTGTPTVTSVSVTSDTTCTVNWSYPGGGVVTGYDVYVNPAVGWINAGTSGSVGITGLSAGTVYYAYIRAKNSYGFGPQSAPSGFVTHIVLEAYLLGGGGGGGGGAFYAPGGGGGGGGPAYSSQYWQTGTITVTIGGQGSGGASGSGSAGGATTATGFTSAGGGGGGAGYSSNAGGASGNGFGGGAGANADQAGGGGGGAGGGGGSYSGNNGGGGGSGANETYTNGSNITRGGGGGGCCRNQSCCGGTGGAGGGGNGLNNNVGSGSPGVNNYGGGGGGGNIHNGSKSGGNGGTGYAVIRYTAKGSRTISGGSVATYGSYTAHIFTGTANLVVS